jgi:N-acetylmuramoyl-L-alanine amidase
MAFLQKVSFCNFISNNPWLLSACRRKKIVIAFASFIIHLSFFLLSNLQIKSEDIIFLEKENYFKVSQITNSLKIFISEKDSLNDIIEISNNNHKRISFLINSHYLSYNDKVYRLTKKVRYSDKELYIPKDGLLHILNYLIEENFSLTYKQDVIYYKIYKKEYILPDEISLQNIIIDPGHGGKEYGATSIYNDHEKIYNLEIALLLKKYLKIKYPKLKIYIIRNKDEIYTLEERSKISNNQLNLTKNSIFISIHCNSVKGDDRTPKGFEIYYLEQKSTIVEDREKLTLQENIINPNKPYIIKKIFSDMYNSMVQRRSIQLANSIDNKLKIEMKYRMNSRGVKMQTFHVLRKNLMPAVLIEIGFITNEDDVKIIANRDMQNKIVKGISEGIKIYAERKDN